MDIDELRDCLVGAAVGTYEPLLDKLGSAITKKFLKDASQEEKESFVKRLKEDQIKKFDDRLSLIMNRVIVDYKFVREFDEIMGHFKSKEELKQDIEKANNHLQSVENERSILQRATDQAIDKLESLCEAILEHKLISLNSQQTS